jgi:hypothetical protein
MNACKKPFSVQPTTPQGQTQKACHEHSTHAQQHHHISHLRAERKAAFPPQPRSARRARAAAANLSNSTLGGPDKAFSASTSLIFIILPALSQAEHTLAYADLGVVINGCCSDQGNRHKPSTK